MASVERAFCAEPRPDVTLTEVDHEQLRARRTYEQERLVAWLG